MAPTASFAKASGYIPEAIFRSVLPNFSPGLPANAFLGKFVLMYPGITLQTRMPWGLSYERKLSRMPMRACFEPP